MRCGFMRKIKKEQEHPQLLRWRPLGLFLRSSWRSLLLISWKLCVVVLCMCCGYIELKLIKFNVFFFFPAFPLQSRVFFARGYFKFFLPLLFFIKQNNDNRSKCNSCFQYFYNCRSVDWKAVVNLELTSMSSLLRILKRDKRQRDMGFELRV